VNIPPQGARLVNPTELTFFTAQELIEELMRRQTFLGVVVHAEEEMKFQHWAGDKMFKVHLNHHLDATQASRLLETVAEYIDKHHG